MFYLPEQLSRYVNLNKDKLFELRLRRDKPAVANLLGRSCQIKYKDAPIITSAGDINEIVYSACDGSLYLYNDCIKRGYITTAEGIRIGLCGRCVYNDESILTITEFNSLCIRFPHQVIGCANQIYNIIGEKNGVASTLILSPPGVGKTTAIRDLSRLISKKQQLNLLIVDEKYEIYSQEYDIGDSCDVILGCDKRFGFFNAIKNNSPDVVVVDELTCVEDCKGVEFARLSGVSVIATAHAPNYEFATKKDYLATLFLKGCFDFCFSLKRGCLGFEILEVVKFDGQNYLRVQ